MLNLFFLITLANAAGPSLLSEAPPTRVLKNQALTFKPKSGFHFNQKAPQSCGKTMAENLSLTSLICQFTESGPQSVSLKICDEKETFCKNEEFKVEVPGIEVTKDGPTQAPARPPLEGFTADTEKALTEAKAGKKILFIDFGASWCPPCNAMEDTVTSTKAFRDASQNFTRVYQDVDLRSSYAWMTRYDIESYPTYVVANADGEELGRFRGSAPLAVFAKWLHGQEALKDQPLSAINPKKASPEQRERLAKELLAQEKPERAFATLSGLDTPSARYLEMRAKVGLAKHDPEKLKTLLPEAIAKFPDRSAVIDWTDAWIKIAPDKAKVLATLDKIAEELKNSQSVRDEGLTDADIYEGLGQAAESVDPKAAEKLYSHAADAFAALIKNSGEKDPRGYNMSRAPMLFYGGRQKEAIALAERMSKLYPKDYVFNRSLARMFFKQKKYGQALKQASLAEKKTYGDIWFAIVSLKVEILVAMKNKAEAKKTAEAALAKIELPQNRELGPHYLAAKLQKLIKDASN